MILSLIGILIVIVEFIEYSRSSRLNKAISFAMMKAENIQSSEDKFKNLAEL